MTTLEFKPQLIATLKNYNRQKFMTDLALKLRTLKGLVFVKGEPSVSKDYGDIAGSLVDVS